MAFFRMLACVTAATSARHMAGHAVAAIEVVFAIIDRARAGIRLG